MAAPITINVVDSNTSTAVGQGGQNIITGAPSPNSAAIGSQPGFQISGVWTGTLSFEETIDGVNYTPINALIRGVNSLVQAATQNGVFITSSSGEAFLRIRATAAMTGAAVVTFFDAKLNDLQSVIITQPPGSTIATSTTGGGSVTVSPANSYFNGALAAAPQVIKNAPGVIASFSFDNSQGSVDVLLNLYDSVAATVGTTATKKQYRIPAATIKDFNFNSPASFLTGISIAAVLASDGVSAPVPGVNVNVEYI